MGTVYNRGTKHKPKWWVGCKERDGAWTYVPSHQPTKEQARGYLNRLESNVAAGLAGIEQRSDAQRCEPLFHDWSETLRNRNARDDRYRLENHLRLSGSENGPHLAPKGPRSALCQPLTLPQRWLQPRPTPDRV